MRFDYFFVFFSIFLILFPVGNAHATDVVNSTSINKPVVKWMKKVSKWDGEEIQASRHYVLYDGYGGTKVLKSEDGEEVWSGYLGYPHLHNDRIYAVNVSGLYSYKANGQLVWHIPREVYGFLGVRITFTHAGILIWNGEQAVCSLISYDGRVLMKKILKQDWGSDLVWVSSSPTLWNNTIYWGVYNYRQNKTVLYAMNIDGHILWNFTDFERNESIRQISVDKNGIIYVQTDFRGLPPFDLRYNIYSINQNGHLKWKFTGKYYKVPQWITFFGIKNNIIYHVDTFPWYVHVQKINCTNGNGIGETNITAVVSWAPYIKREEVIVLDSSMNIYLIYKGNLSSYTPNGTLRWNISVGDYITRFTLQNDSIYVLTEHGYVYSLRAQSDFKTNLSLIITLSGIFIGLLILGLWEPKKKKNN